MSLGRAGLAGAEGATPTGTTAAPALARRMAAFVYEGIVLFGVLMLAGFVYSAATQMRHALHGSLGLKIFLFCVLGAYFTWLWSHGGQTVAMKAWHLKLVDARGGPVGPVRALARYLAAWMWFVPALAIAHFSGVDSTGGIFGVLAVGVASYAALTRLHPERQFWHDMVCGTRMVDARAAATG